MAPSTSPWQVEQSILVDFGTFPSKLIELFEETIRCREQEAALPRRGPTPNNRHFDRHERRFGIRSHEGISSAASQQLPSDA